MKSLILSHFDNMKGPKIIFIASESSESLDLDDYKKIPHLMNLYQRGFFVHLFEGIKSANLIFQISSKLMRGHKETFLISLLNTEGEIDLGLSRELIEQFVKEFKKIEEAYKAFSPNPKKFPVDKAKLEEIKTLFFNFWDFYGTLPKKITVTKQKGVKIFIFGLAKAGKTTIIQGIRNEIPTPTIPTTNVNIARLFVENLSMFAYDAPGQSKFRDMWEPYFKNQDGLVFVLDSNDIGDEEKVSEARKILHKIANLPELSNLPLLILFNKIDLGKPNFEKINKILGVDQLENKDIKCFLTSALTREGINEAFSWLSDKISIKNSSHKKQKLGIIFSKWDENQGPEVISYYPKNAFDDPEVISIRCFSTSQIVFGDKEFKKISYVLPFNHLNSKAAIFFDSVKNDNIRGGKMPLSLIIFFDESIPSSIIDQFNSIISKKLTQIKKYYSNLEQIQKDLVEIFNLLSEKLKNLESTVKVLKKAEDRYQLLFEAARDAILIIDNASGIIVEANKRAGKLIGLSSEEIIGLSLSQLQPGGEYIDIEEEILKQIQFENAPPIEVVLKIEEEKGERIIPVEINASEVQFGNQNLIHCILRDITDRKMAEEALIRSENTLKQAQEIAHMGSYELNLKTLRVNYSEEIFRIFGLDPEEYDSHEIKDLDETTHPDDIDIIKKAMKKMIKENIVEPLEYRVVRPDGSERHVRAEGNIYCDSEGKPVKMIGTLLDITERKKAEEALRENEELLKKSQEISHIGSFNIDLKNNKVRYSDEWYKIQGIKREDFEFNDVNDVMEKTIHPDDLIKIQTIMKKVIEGEKTSPIEYRIIRPDGTERIVLGEGTITYDKAGIPIGMIGSIQDITERKRIEANIIENERKYRRLFENAPDGITLVDSTGIIMDCNQVDQRLLGYKKEEIIGKNLMTFISDECKEDCKQKFQFLIENGQMEAEIEVVSKDGFIIPVWRKGLATYDSKNEFSGAILHTRDITEKKKIEKSMKHTLMELNHIFNVSIPLRVIDENFNIISLNDSYCSYFKVNREDVIGNKCYELFKGQQCLTDACSLLLLQKGMERCEYESETELDNGRKINFILSALPFIGPDDEFKGIVESFLDITDFVNSEKGRSESEERFQILSENAKYAVFTFDLRLKCTYMSPSVERVLGYTPEEALNLKLSDYHTPKSMKIINNVLAEELKNELRSDIDRSRSRVFEVEEICKDGKIIIAEIIVTFQRDHIGNPIGILGMTRNISIRKKLEAEREEIIRSLDKRVIELRCLHNIYQIITNSDILSKKIEKILKEIPPILQYPELASAKIIIDYLEYSTIFFEESPIKISSDIIVKGKKEGQIIIYYPIEKNGLKKKKFLNEELALIKNIAVLIGYVIERDDKKANIILSND
ncbi:MAG: PAS domain S-box protein [archaeon]|nr:PAS domain S-box protein [archaeon]